MLFFYANPTSFRTAFYLRSNYVNKEGKTPVMLRISLNNERLSIGSTGISVVQTQWDSANEKIKGRTTEALSINLELDSIRNGLQSIYRKLEDSDDLCLERIKSEYLGKKVDIDTIMQLFDKHNADIAQQVGVSVAPATLQKYNVCKRRFAGFLQHNYKRSDLKLSELTFTVIREFDIYLRTVVGQNPNTATKTMKTFKTIVILGGKMGVIHHDPFINHRFHLEPVNRGFLTDEEILKIANKDFGLQRLELVRDIFIFSCFTGLAYIDVANLTPEHIVTSKHNTLVSILENEFSEELPDPLPNELAPILLGNKFIQAVFARYDITDDFDGSAEYDLLYTELTGTIVELIENSNLPTVKQAGTSQNE